MRSTRRAFIRRASTGLAAASLSLGAGCGRRGASPAQAGPAEPASEDAAAPDAHTGLAPVQPSKVPNASGRSVVVCVTCDGALTDDGVDAEAVGRMIETGMSQLLGTNTATEAFARLFSPDDVVGLKVNCLAGPMLPTNPEVAYGLTEALIAAGLQARNLLVYDRDTSELSAVGYSACFQGADVRCYGSNEVGYDLEPTVVRSVGTCFSRIVSQMATALVNVPVLKDHDVAGLSCALKNHYGSIHNPNKLHMDHCSPYVADLNTARILRDKGRLVVCDALRVCYDGGPSFKPETTVTKGVLLFGLDPVAVDWAGLQMIEQLRSENGMPPLKEEEREPVYITQAAAPERGLGRAGDGAVDIVRVTV